LEILSTDSNFYLFLTERKGRRVSAESASGDGFNPERGSCEPAGEELPHGVHTQQHSVCVGRSS
ncbi:hypothetical protein GOODEAATRI_031052, partial [Goodea atripinnis]